MNNVPVGALSHYILFPFFVIAKRATRIRGGGRQPQTGSSLLSNQPQQQTTRRGGPPLSHPPNYFCIKQQMAGGTNTTGRKAGVANYSRHYELHSLMGMILGRLPITSWDGWDSIVNDHAKLWPFFSSQTSIKTKYAAVKRIKSSAGNPNMPE